MVVSLYPAGDFPCTFFCLRLRQPHRHSAAGRIKSMKNQITPPGIELATLRLVGQRLNQLRHPQLISTSSKGTVFVNVLK
jgi:hypothetical protein